MKTRLIQNWKVGLIFILLSLISYSFLSVKMLPDKKFLDVMAIIGLVLIGDRCVGIAIDFFRGVEIEDEE